MDSISKKPSCRFGFTVVELIVAMAVTTVIVSVLVSITSIALESWNRGRSELRSAAQAKAIIDTISKDLETIVYRRGTSAIDSTTREPAEWFKATSDGTPPGPSSFRSSNAIDLMFFTAASDRYSGNLGTTPGNDQEANKGGNISLVAYRLAFRSPFEAMSRPGAGNSLILNRYLKNPDEALQYMGLETLNMGTVEGDLSSPDNFVAENIFQFTLIFHVEVTPPSAPGSAPSPPQVIPIVINSSGSNSSVDSFRINGSGITVPRAVNGFDPSVIQAGRLMSAEISVTVLSDRAVQQIQQRSFPDQAARANFINQNSYQYSRLVALPKL